MDQGVKTSLWQLVLPQQLISRALIGFHDQCGHQSRDRTLLTCYQETHAHFSNKQGINKNETVFTHLMDDKYIWNLLSKFVVI